MSFVEHRNKISIVIPVIGEGERINELIDHLKQQDADPLELIVVDGDPGKSTIHALTHDDVIVAGVKKGRAFQMNAGAALAQGDILLFLHADTRLPDKACDQIRDALLDDDLVGGAFELSIASGHLAYNLISQTTTWRSRLTRTPYGDQAIFIRRKFFNEIGGYQNMPLLEDVNLMNRVKQSGQKITILKQQVTTSARRWESQGITRTTLRNQMIKLGYLLGVSPERLAQIYYRDQKGE